MSDRRAGLIGLLVAASMLVAACGAGSDASNEAVVARRADLPATTAPTDVEEPGSASTAPTTTTLPPPTTAPPTTEPVPAPVEALPVSTIPTEPERTEEATDAADSEAGAPAQLFVPSWPPYTPRPGLTEVAALTGLPATEEIASAPIVVAKIDNVGRARPQWNLDRADVIIEENVEGATRFLALFHSDVPAEIGPVRSARTTDVDLLPAMNRPVLAWSGGNEGVTKWVAAADDAGLVVDVAAVRHGCYHRDSSKRSPHNLVARTDCVVDRGNSGGAGAALPLWAIDATWVPDGLATTADTFFTVPMDGGLDAGWEWDPATARYLRSQNGIPHLSASGEGISASNVVVLTVVHRPSVIDARSPHAETIGSGTGVVHRDGRAIPVTWSRPSTYDPFQFIAADGSRVPLQVGRTFVELSR